MRLRLLCVIAAMLLVGMAGLVQADTITVNNPVVAPAGPAFLWTYTAGLTGTGAIAGPAIAGQPDYFQINNVRGFLGFAPVGPIAGAGGSLWSTAAIPAGGGAFNLVFTYLGNAGNMFETIDPIVTVSFLDSMGKKQFGTYTSNSHLDNSPALGPYDVAITQSVFVPVPTPVAALGGMLLMGIMVARKAMQR